MDRFIRPAKDVQGICNSARGIDKGLKATIKVPWRVGVSAAGCAVEEKTLKDENQEACDTVLTMAEASKLTKLHKNTIARACKRGELKGRNLGGRAGWITTWSALKEWVETGNSETP